MPDLRTHRYRVAQWATGTIGTHALRSIIEHPHLELTAVHVFGTDKVGTDAGELCGLNPTGIWATHSIEAILDAAPDCVLYMPAAPDAEQLCRLLAAGICRPVSVRRCGWWPTRSGCRWTRCTPSASGRSRPRTPPSGPGISPPEPSPRNESPCQASARATAPAIPGRPQIVATMTD
ncbi:hypothetical protein [Mycolicibacterium peregrinum]|uniref:Uncharacterized protein n=1 Tax=Mycolicibacterium peregrinum TaxID=43304 RepID=A0A4Z0I1S8_MYCPR|nr:hypothetical protein [Mycolicibacterium peregrinum]TGB45045.1 hypothetical protein EJD98_06015 [Mycolicibacterium peregrinum]TGB46479.1 hypothetical protein EJD94_05935 [Mycolicibacterium peregrinum]